MNILAGLETFLYVISSALFYPVIAGLVLLTFWIVISFGGFLRKYIERTQGDSSVLSRYKRTLESELRTQNSELLTLNRSDTDTLDIRLERLLQSTEIELIKSLDKIRFAIRVGPALGLMGTLIPMGIALSALAQGDMPKMAGSMVTAFTTTVVGLACGVAAYLMSLVKEKWIRADMREIEYITELALRSSTQDVIARSEATKQSHHSKIVSPRQVGARNDRMKTKLEEEDEVSEEAEKV